MRDGGVAGEQAGGRRRHLLEPHAACGTRAGGKTGTTLVACSSFQFLANIQHGNKATSHQNKKTKLWQVAVDAATGCCKLGVASFWHAFAHNAKGVVAAASYWTAAAAASAAAAAAACGNNSKKGLRGWTNGGQNVRLACASKSVERRSRTR
ncbi:hypothetical protein ACLKA7_014430 [Drosophila subpalustris]